MQTSFMLYSSQQLATRTTLLNSLIKFSILHRHYTSNHTTAALIIYYFIDFYCLEYICSLNERIIKTVMFVGHGICKFRTEDLSQIPGCIKTVSFRSLWKKVSGILHTRYIVPFSKVKSSWILFTLLVFLPCFFSLAFQNKVQQRF